MKNSFVAMSFLLLNLLSASAKAKNIYSYYNAKTHDQLLLSNTSDQPFFIHGYVFEGPVFSTMDFVLDSSQAQRVYLCNDLVSQRNFISIYSQCPKDIKNGKNPQKMVSFLGYVSRVKDVSIGAVHEVYQCLHLDDSGEIAKNFSYVTLDPNYYMKKKHLYNDLVTIPNFFALAPQK